MKKILSILLVSVLVLSACSDEFFDINKSPNKAIEDNMTPSLVIPRAMHRMAAFSVTDYDVYLRWMGYWARCSGTYGPNTDEEAYMLTSSFNRLSWLTMYDILKDFDVAEKNAKLRNETAYEAMAKIMKSVGFMQLVDQYGNVPYSKAFNLSEYMLTPYDKGADIYTALIADLEAADALLAAYTNDTELASKNLDVAKADIMFKGMAAKWRKFGNTQRLRLVMHQTGILSAAALKAEVDKIVANGAGFLGAGETAEVQAGYVADVDKQNPYWNEYKLNDTGGLDNYNRANKYFLSLLSSMNDLRYTYFYSKAATPKHGDYVGFAMGFDYPSGTADADKDAAANSSNVAGPGIAKSATMPQWVLPSFESLFLQAEAIQRGALTGDAKAAYETAVKESFKWLGAPDSVAVKYLSDPIKTKQVWDMNTDKLEMIMTQKYISMFGINGLETWTDYRRTGFPKELGGANPTMLSISPNRGTNVIPLRLIYPQEEYQYNQTNAVNEGTIDPQSQKIFWDNN